MTFYGLDVEQYLVAALNPQPSRGHKIPPKPLRKQDQKIISDYMSERVSLKPSTAKVLCTYLVMFSRELPESFSNIDTKMVLQYISQSNTKLKQNTRRRYYPIIKTFLTWLIREKVNKKLNMDKISPNLKAPALDLDGRKPSMMLTGDDIKKLIETAHTSRDRALIAMQFEGALRPIEIVSATWADLNFDKYGAQFTTSKKTGKSRYIRLIMSAPYLLEWKNDHPKPEPDMPVFVSLKSAKFITPLTQSGLKTLIHAIAKEALPNKQVFPYLMRHSRITSLMADEVSSQIVSMQAWGTPNSRMLSTYTHLSNADIDRVLLSRAGIQTEETKKDESLKPRQCSYCGKMNTPTDKFCAECGTPLTNEAKEIIQTESQEEREKIRTLGGEIFTRDDVEAMVKAEIEKMFSKKK